MQQPEAPPNYHGYQPGRAAAGEWPRPEPLIGQIGRRPCPADALPMAIRRAVEEVKACVQAPVELVASSALATASLAAHERSHHAVKSVTRPLSRDRLSMPLESKIPPRLWCPLPPMFRLWCRK